MLRKMLYRIFQSLRQKVIKKEDKTCVLLWIILQKTKTEIYKRILEYIVNLRRCSNQTYTRYDNMNSIFEELEKYRLDFINAFKHRNDNQDAADKYKKSKISYINKTKQLQQEYNESLLKTVKNNENLYGFL